MSIEWHGVARLRCAPLGSRSVAVVLTPLLIHVVLQVSLSLCSCKPMMLLHPGAWHWRDLMCHTNWRYIAPSKERKPQLNPTLAGLPVSPSTS